MSVGIQAGRHRVLVRQIAGLLARRLVTYSRDGEVVQQGDRMGLMKFSSRMDVFLPLGSTIRVREGEMVAAGVTPIADLPAG
jgi:phosphatidylserine decarboxylase